MARLKVTDGEAVEGCCLLIQKEAANLNHIDCAMSSTYSPTRLVWKKRYEKLAAPWYSSQHFVSETREECLAYKDLSDEWEKDRDEKGMETVLEKELALFLLLSVPLHISGLAVLIHLESWWFSNS